MIVFPMAGESRRFYDAGYKVPKYMLEAHGHSLFWHAVSSFKKYFKEHHFLFIYRDINKTTDFIESECQKMGIESWAQIVLPEITRGQADTVEKGLNIVNISIDEPLTIFNIDTFRPGFEFPKQSDLHHADGYLEVFRGSGANWSYVLPENQYSTKVIETAEKKPISNFCCTGLYHFREARFFFQALYSQTNSKGKAEQQELYIAPLYNVLIDSGYDIRYHLIERKDVLFCGIPEEYEAFKY